MATLKREVLTFKADDKLSKALRALPNKSDFIRKAILSALDHKCPVCQGAGVLSLQQKKHFDEFLNTHAVQECNTCKAYVITCESNPTKKCPAKR